jgi:hypothetical protein
MRKIACAALAALTLAGCGSVALDNTDTRRAVALAPYQRVVQPFGMIRVPEGTVFYPGIADGQRAWCSMTATYFLPGEGRSLCMIDPTTGDHAEGWFTKAFPSASYSGTRFDVDIPYRVGQTAPLPPRR